MHGGACVILRHAGRVSLHVWGPHMCTMTLVAGMHARLPLCPCPDPAAGLLLGRGQGLGHKAAWAGAQRSWARLPSSFAHLTFMHIWLTRCESCKGIPSTLNITAQGQCHSPYEPSPLIPSPPAGLSDALVAAVHSQSCHPQGTQQSQPASQAKHVSLCVTHVVEPGQPP